MDIIAVDGAGINIIDAIPKILSEISRDLFFFSHLSFGLEEIN